MRLSLLTALILSLFTAGLCAQENRILGRIDNNQRVQLPGRVRPEARPEFDRGAVAPTFALPAITLNLKASAAQQSALEQTLAEQQDASSPNYHKWLTPEQYADRFGASQSDIAKLTGWLESEGFHVGQVARSRTWIQFSGTAQQVQNAFQTTVHRYEVNGETHYANSTNPSVPAAFANMVGGFRGLNDFRLKPRSLRRAPKITNSDGSHNIAPDDFATIYDVARLYSSGIDGTGQKLVVVGQTDIDLSDLRTFRSTYNLPAADPQKVLVPGETNPGITGDESEADLDLEWSGAVARKATIIYVFSGDVITSLTYAIDQNLAPVLSMSYGSCEQSDLIDLPALRSMAQQANTQGMTWLNASGDAAAADCDSGDNDPVVAQSGLSVDAPASIPEVTAMGGTELNEQRGSYWASTNTANGASALSYIPETAWNDTALISSLAGGGGGTSVFFPKPEWQTGPGVHNEPWRLVPDLSVAASAQHDGYVVYSAGSSDYYGGTSISAPTMAGIVTLLNQYLVSAHVQSQPGVGNINPTLYRLAQNVPGVFHDVTSGNNIVPCVIGSPGCNSGSYGYSAGSGYDQATGLGSPDAYNFVHQWSSAPPHNSGVAVSFDSNPVFQSGNSWPFTITLTEEAGVGTTLTGLVINNQSYNVATTFGATSLQPDGSVSSTNLSLSGLSVPANVTFLISGQDANGVLWSEQLSIPFAGPQEALIIGGSSNAASGQQTYAPGMLLSVYGTQLGAFVQSAGTVPLPEYLAGFEAYIQPNPQSAPVYTPLYYVSPGQVNLQIPYEAPTGQVTLTVGNPYQNVNFTLNIVPAAPGIFMSNGFVSAPYSNASRGQETVLYITGEGQVQPSLPTGTSTPFGTPTNQLPQPVLPYSVSVAGEQAKIDFIGIPSGLVGVTQINYVVPADAPVGTQQVIVTVGGVASPPAKLTITQ